MQKVTIKEDGIYFSYWEEDSADWVDRKINDSNLPFSWYLPYPVKLEEGITLRQLLTHLSFYKEQVEDIFSNALRGVACDTVHDVIVSNEPTDTDHINYLYLFKIGELIPTNDDYVLIRTSPVIMGLYIEEKGKFESEDVYHLSSFPIEEWVDLPIAIDYFIEYIDPENEDFNLSGLVNWHFFEIIHTILSQISLTLQVTETIPISDKKTESGPLTISELFGWITELDRILLN